MVCTTVALALCVWGNVPTTSALDLDPATLWRLPPGTPLRWDNVASAPVWVDGVAPCLDKSSRLRLVRLAPGQHTTIRLPSRAMVRVASPRGPLGAGDIQLWVSNGSGLYRGVLTAVSVKDRSLIAVPDLTEPGLVRIERPTDASCALEVALFTSRRVFLQCADDFLRPLLAEGDTVELSVDDSHQRRTCSVLHPGCAARLPVCGPTRLRLDTRLQFQPGESQAVQTYQLRIRLDGDRPRIIELQTSAEGQHVVYVDGRPRVVGRSEVEYVDIPPGNHNLTVESTACVYLHVLSRSPSPSQPSAGSPVFPVRWAGSQAWPSIWNTPDELFARQLQVEPPDLDAYRATALRSARDNQYREGGQRAWWLLKTLAASHPEMTALNRLAQRAGQYHTSYRNLLPVRQSLPVQPRSAWCFKRRLRAVDAEGPQLILAEQLIEDATDLLSLARLVRFPADQATEAVYCVPEHLGPTQLRVLVDLSCQPRPAQLWLSCDDCPPVALRVLPRGMLSSADFAISRAEAGLAALHWRHPQYDAGTLGGPFALRHAPAALTDVGSVELTVPHGVRQIRISYESCGGGPLDVGLQYRAGRHYELTESAYLEFSRRASSDGLTLLACVQGNVPSSCSDPVALEELRNHWLPLQQWLRERQRNFAVDLVPPVAAGEQPTAPPEPSLTDQLRQARRLSQSGDWMLALECWTRLLPRVPASMRSEVLRHRTRALEQLQEPYLVEQELRGMLCFDPDPEVKAMAWRYLRERYEREGDRQGLQALAATGLLLDPSRSRLQEVTRVLLQDGQWSLALMAGLGLPCEPHEANGLLLAACQLRWWQVFDRLLTGLPPGETRHYWEGIRQLYDGRSTQAEQLLLQAGQRGHQLVPHLRWGHRILQQLKDPRPVQRLIGIAAWEKWQASHPGPAIWEPDDQSVIQCAGAASVYAVGRDRYIQYYRAQPDQPVWLEVQGPVVLQLEARPLHDSQVDHALHDELMVRGAGREHIYAINNNRASTGLQLVDDPARVPGYGVEGTLPLGPGRHRLQVAASHLDVLIRVRVRRPACPLPVLPPLTCQTVQAVLDGRFGVSIAGRSLVETKHGPDETAATVRLIPASGPAGLLPIPLVRQAVQGPVARESGAPILSSLEHARWNFRCGRVDSRQIGPLLAWAATDHGGQHLAERGELLIRYAADPGLLISQRTLAATPFVEQAVSLHRGQVEAALAVDPGSDLAACRQRLALLVRLAEGDLTQRHRYLILAAQQMDRVPWLSDLTATEARLMRGVGWSLFREVESSAGLHSVTQQSWSPESPGLRIRRALFAPSESAHYLVSGYAQLRLRLSSTRGTVTQLTLVRPQLGYRRPTPVTVRWHVNDKLQQQIVLDQPHVAQRVNVRLPAGDHQVRLELDRPLAGQYVLVQLHELLSPNERRAWFEQPDARPQERLYHVATQDQPLRFRVFGPSRIRVDELAGNLTRTRYFSVLDGQQQFELSPPRGVDVTLLRVFEFQLDDQQPVLDIDRADRQRPSSQRIWLEQLPNQSPAGPPTVEPAWFAAPAVGWGDQVGLLSLTAPQAPPQWVDLPDAFPLGGQEQGTWSVAMGAFYRRPVDEDFQSGAPDKFAELRVGYDQFDRWQDTSSRTDTRVRLRESSGPTWGLGHERWWKWPSGDNSLERDGTGRRSLPNNLVLHGDLYGFLQAPAGALAADDNQLEGSLGTSLRAFRRLDLTERTWHLPTATVFGRWLSLDEVRYRPGRVDQDVFTLYKSDHRTGLRLSDTWVHQPRVDTQLWLRPALTTNEDYNVVRPDHITLHTGCATYLAGVVLDLSYRVTRYTNDGDRDGSSTQQFLYGDALLEHWRHAGCRYELGLSVRHELSQGETSANLVLIRYFSKGRGYRDMPPGRVDFLGLRQQRHLAAWLQEYAYPN